MFSVIKKEISWNGANLVIETGKIARRADGSVLVRYGGTVVLCTVVFDKKSQGATMDFFPLGVHYFEKPYAAGKFPGGFSKREGKPADREVLISRIIDRSIRPLFNKNFMNETQIMCQVLNYDSECSPEIPAIIGASAAVMISGIPCDQAVAVCKVGMTADGECYAMRHTATASSIMECHVSGTKDGIIMVESKILEVADSNLVDAIGFAHDNYQPILEMIDDFTREVAKRKFVVKSDFSKAKEIYTNIKTACASKIRRVFNVKSSKATRDANIAKILEDHLASNPTEDLNLTKKEFTNVVAEIFRAKIVETSKRIDGRELDEIRPLYAESGMFSKAHGTGMFTRGETQVLAFMTLGGRLDELVSENLDNDVRESFYLHYNFNPYAVGEASKLGSVSRREIGHGKLAHKALSAVMPTKTEFPYTVRIVAEVTESNGSSSMATVCASSLALINGGVPIKTHVAGVAMGLIKDKKKGIIILTDIAEDEDHLGDMDFKVAGTVNGLTALQMDIKIKNVDKEIIKAAVSKARIAINVILNKMSEVAPIDKTVVSSSTSVSQVKSIKIPDYSVPELIGSGGRAIKEIVEKTGSKIDVLDGGNLRIFAKNKQMLAKTLELIKNTIKGPDEGKEFSGLVVKIIKSGAFVKVTDNKEGFLHISEISDKRIEEVTDVLKVGDKINVIVLSNSKGKVKFSMKRNSVKEEILNVSPTENASNESGTEI